MLNKSFVLVVMFLFALSGAILTEAQELQRFRECEDEILFNDLARRNRSGLDALNFRTYKSYSASFNADGAETLDAFVPDFLVNTNKGPRGGDQSWPAIAALQNGSFIVVWHDERNGDRDIFAQLYDENSTPLGDNFRVDDDEKFSNPYGPAVASDHDGNFVITWWDRRDNHSTIYAQRYAPDGTPTSNNFKVNDDDVKIWRAPTITMNDNGDFMIAFMGHWQYEDRYLSEDIFAQGFFRDGSRSGSTFKVNESGMEAHCCSRRPAITPDGKGNFIIAWKSNYPSNIYARHVAIDGTTLRSTFNVSDDTGKWAPAIASNQKGQFIIAWRDRRNGDEDIYAQCYNEAGTAVGNNFRVNDDNGNAYQSSPAVAMDDNGNVLVIWSDERDERDIYAQRLKYDGTKVENNFKINDGEGSFSKYYFQVQVVADEQGDYYITWGDSRHGEQDIYVQRLMSTGIHSGNNFKVNDDVDSGLQTSPEIATDRYGNFVVVWNDKIYSYTDIYARRYDFMGIPIGVPFRVNDDEGMVYRYGSMSITQNGAGEFIIVWLDVRNNEKSIYAQRYSRNGAPQGPNFHVNNDLGTGYLSSPSVGIDGSGNFIITWRAEVSSENDDDNIYAKRYTFNGTASGSTFRVNDVEDSADVNRQPCIAVNSKGNVIISWVDRRENYKSDIYAQRYSSDGSAEGQNFKVNKYVENAKQYRPHSAVDGQGNFLIVWQFDNDSLGVYAQRYDQNGDPLGDNFQVTNFDGGSISNYSAIAMDRTGRFVIAWDDYYTGNGDIYGQRYSSDGKPLNGSFRLNTTGDRIQWYPSVQLSNGKIYTAWADNRTPGKGYDIWANIQYWDEEAQASAKTYNLYQCYPNPFNAATTIRFNLPNSGFAKITVYNVLGKEIEMLYEGTMSKGLFEFDWTPTNQPSGIYLCRLETEGYNKTMKMLYIK